MESDFDRMQELLKKGGAKVEQYAPLAGFVGGGESGAPWENELASAKSKGWVARGQ